VVEECFIINYDFIGQLSPDFHYFMI